MPQQVHSVRHRPEEGRPRRRTPASTANIAMANVDSVGADCAARDPKEIAAYFPIPSAELADRLVDLLLPRPLVQPKGHEAA
jgi:hypothetical protein